jgi:predicted transcriptional regulator
MDDEIELISDGDGLAVIGNPAAVDRFLAAANMPSKDLELARLGSVFSAGSGIAKAGSEVAANSGCWIKLTEESAKALKVSEVMKGSSDSVARAILTDKGKIKGILEFVKTPGSMLTNPAMLAGVAGIMAQLAMQQTMDEITDYLANIDEKVDDILRAQKDAALADMIAVGFMIEEAMTIREHVGRVSEVNWSKVQNSSMTIARTQAYALRQLDALAEKLERKRKVGDLAEASKEAEGKVEEWLAVLARCFQLQDAIAVLELDRVLDSSPDELDDHRRALRMSRQNRLEKISRSTEQLMARMDAAAGVANTKVLLHPFASGSVVDSSNHVVTAVTEFHAPLGIKGDRHALESKRWVEAVDDARHDAVALAANGVNHTKRFGAATVGLAKSTAEKVSQEVSERLHRHRNDEGDTRDVESPNSRES